MAEETKTPESPAVKSAAPLADPSRVTDIVVTPILGGASVAAERGSTVVKTVDVIGDANAVIQKILAASEKYGVNVVRVFTSTGIGKEVADALEQTAKFTVIRL